MPQVRVHDAKASRAREQRQARGMRIRTDERGHAGYEHSACFGHGHIGQIARIEAAGRRSRPVIANPRSRILQHQPRRPLVVSVNPACVDALFPQRVENAVPERISAEPADPGHTKSETRKADAGVALGAGVIHSNGFARFQRSPGRRRQRQHRFTDGDHVEFFGFGQLDHADPSHTLADCR